MDKFSKEQRSKIMASIKSRDTKEEVLLAKALWNRGYRYRKNNKKIFGKPDISFARYKIAIFVDGEFFHGYNWDDRKLKILTNRDYWIPKIERNIQRDKNVNHHLLSNGWIVIRFWSSFVKKNLNDCIQIIEDELKKRNSNFVKDS
jgi:DNA mismatch endonuclease (patch repair protein)